MKVEKSEIVKSLDKIAAAITGVSIVIGALIGALIGIGIGLTH